METRKEIMPECKCGGKGYTAWAEPCDCPKGQLYGLHIMLVGPKIASGNVEDIKHEIENLRDTIKKLREDFVKVKQGICLDCEFWKYEVSHMREWTREYYKKLRKEIEELKKCQPTTK